MNGQQSIHLIKEGANLYWRTLGRCRGIEHYGAGDIEYVLSSPRGGIERIFDVQLAPGTEELRIHEIIHDMRAGSLPDNVLIIPGTNPEDLAERFAAEGFSIDDSGLCMAMNLEDLGKGAPAHLSTKVLHVQDMEMLAAWTKIVNAALFEFELMRFEQISDLFALKWTDFYLGMDEGVPAAVAMTMRYGNAATLEMVATLPEHRRRGLGTAVIGEALHRLHEDGVQTVSLRAEPDGIPLYHRIGFKEYCRRIVASC